MDAAAVDRWMEAYRAAWISNVPSEVAELFTEDAVYAVSPFAEPWTGRDDPVRVEYDGVLVVRFAPDGRCSEHREWYFRRELPG